MIFVSIVSYRDSDLVSTIEDCLRRAWLPDQLHLAVLEQNSEPSDIPKALIGRAGRFSYLHLDHRYSRGPCWARSMIGTYLRDEEFFFQIDAHMRFDDGWDDLLVQAHRRVSARNPRAIISSYPCAFEQQGGVVSKRKMPGMALVLKPRPEASLGETTPVLAYHAIPTPVAGPIPGFHVGAGCLFANASLLQQVPIDPWLYFHGEEQDIAVRAWTHGWDIWHMPDMPIYHLYHSGGGRPVHWDAGDDAEREFRWWELDRQAAKRLSSLLYVGADLGVYGLGSVRSLDEFAAASGVDYLRRQIRSAAL
jgi:hypothetical protein